MPKPKKMESKKKLKNKNNALLKTLEAQAREISEEDALNIREFESQFSFSPQTENLLKASVSEQAVENIKHIFNKTQTIRKVADGKHQEIQAQFKELRERLKNSSECLQKMKNGIDNIKFSYQTKAQEIHRTLTPPGDYSSNERYPPFTREEMEERMEDIRDKIEKIQRHVYSEKDKQEKVIKNYKEAFDNVTYLLESIDRGDYSSFNPNNKEEDK